MKPQTVVIIDDRITNLKILERLAASLDEGVRVLTFANPRSALEVMAKEPPDLIITDFKMPDLDGAEFIRQFKVQDTAADVPVIVITAYEDKDLRYRALEAGATDYLLSPVDHHEIRARSRNLLTLRRQQRLLKERALSLEEKILVEERRHRDALRQSHERLLRVIDAVPVMIGATDREGRCVFANSCWAEAVGVDGAEPHRPHRRRAAHRRVGAAQPRARPLPHRRRDGAAVLRGAVRHGRRRRARPRSRPRPCCAARRTASPRRSSPSRSTSPSARTPSSR